MDPNANILQYKIHSDNYNKKQNNKYFYNKAHIVVCLVCESGYQYHQEGICDYLL